MTNDCRNQIRATRSAALDSIKGDEQVEYLGVDGRDFTFEDVGSDVQFVEASAKVASNEENGLDEIRRWIDSYL